MFLLIERVGPRNTIICLNRLERQRCRICVESESEKRMSDQLKHDIDLSREVREALVARKRTLATAESCTGGWIAKTVTDIAGSSHVFDRGFVTYTNQSKQDMLGVSAQTLADHGAVSEETVREMAEGAIDHSMANTSLAVSGIAGPGGGSNEKPVGTVCFAWSGEGFDTVTQKVVLEGDREQVRSQAVVIALKGLLNVIQ